MGSQPKTKLRRKCHKKSVTVIGAVTMLLAVGMANAAAVYGGGVACTASYIKIVYYMALGIGPSLLLKTRDKRGGHGSEITDKTIVKPPTAHE